MKRLKTLRRFQLSLPLTLLSAVLLAGFITVLALWCQPNALRAVAKNLLAQPLLIVLNALPAGLLLLAFTPLLRNVFYSGALVNLLVCGFSIVNRIKIEVRDEPLFPRDLGLLKEAAGAMGVYAIRFPWGTIALVVGVSLVFAAAGVFVGCKPLPTAWLKARFRALAARETLLNRLLRLAGSAASLAVLTVLIFTVYASNDLYNSFKVSNAYYVPSVFNELGFPYCFGHHFTTYQVDRPAGYSRGQAEGWESEHKVYGQGKDVSVIMVMNEAFSDITDHEAFAYTDETEPLPHLQALRQDPHAIVGHMVVPSFAGGTANTEFDVLTGLQSNALSATTTSSMRAVNGNVDSLFRLYGASGYQTSYFHPGDDWFYNRENVMRWFGAEETRFIDEMPAVTYKGRWVTDESLVGYIQEAFESAVAGGTPLFHYTTTIQNHMSYNPDKYGDGYKYPALPMNKTISGFAETLLKVYTEGARDADAMLGQLTDYFSGREEPVVLVFFGDHLPYLGDNQHGYSELGMTDEPYWAELTSYESPYVIWANDAAAAALDWETAAAELALPEQISASFLGAAVAELTQHGDNSAWFTFLNDLRRTAPVIHKQTTVLADGTILTVPEDRDSALRQSIQKWRQWSYYKLRQQTFPS